MAKGKAKQPQYSQAPAALGADGRQLWDRINTEYELSEGKLVILEHACVALDRKRQAEREISEHGLVLRTGGLVRSNPACKTEGEQARVFLAYMRELGLDLDPLHDTPGRPAGS